MEKLLNNGYEELDAVMLEWMYSEIYTGSVVLTSLESVFNCRLIWSSPMKTNEILMTPLNEHSDPGTSSAKPESIWRRVKKQVKQLHGKFHRWLPSYKEKSVFNRAFGLAMAKKGGILAPFEVAKHNGSLLLGNSHLSTGQTFRLPLNYTQIAGYHIEEKIKPLNKNLRMIMDGSKKGVIYFSMGSTMKGNTFSENIITDILEVFKKINMTVIWQYERKLNQLAPSNVHVFDQVPQRSILAHPNCVLFITTGELQSFIEAVHFGVPFIGIPILENQFNNIEKAVNNGFVKNVDILDTNILKTNMNGLHRDIRFRRQIAKELRSIYRSRRMFKVVWYWVRHVTITFMDLNSRSPITVESLLELAPILARIAILTPITCFFVLTVYILIRQNDDDLCLTLI